MRRFVGFLAVLIMATVVVVKPVAAEEERPDWIVVTATAGAEGAEDITIRVHGEAMPDANEPFAYGGGLGSTRSGGHIFVSDTGQGGPSRLATTRELGSFEVVVDEGEVSGGSLEFGASYGYLSAVEPGDSVGALLFLTGYAFDEIVVDEITVSRGDVEVVVDTGSGSSPLMAVDPDFAGSAAAVGPAGAGSATEVRTIEAGIAGGYSFGFCRICTGSWTAPDGRAGSWTSTYASAVVAGFGSASGDFGFGGPSGEWSWSWSGAGVQDRFLGVGRVPVYGAWAPIGDAWRMFTR